MEAVRRGQKEVAEKPLTPLSVKNAIYVAADDLQLRSMDFRSPLPADQTHLGTRGILTLGERFAAALERAWKQNR